MTSWPQFWDRLTIAAKLKLSFGVLFFVSVIIVFAWFLSLELEKRSETEIDQCREIENMVLDMDRKMEKAKRLHRDFFLYHARIGLAEAHVQYAQPSVRLVAQAVAISSDLKQKIQASGVNHTLGRRNVDLNLYLSSAKRFADTSIQSIELISRLASPEHGLEARFERLSADLVAKAAGLQKMRDQLQEISTFYLQYKVSRKRHVMQSAFNVIYLLQQDIGMPGLSELAEPREVDEMLASLKRLGDEILITDYAIQQVFNDFSLQVQNIAPISQALVDIAREEVERARQKVLRTHRTTSFLITALICLALLFSAIVARMIHRSVAGRITDLTESTARMRRGHLDVSVAEDSADEVGQLGKTFNMMAGRIKELVDDLESKVLQRTEESAVRQSYYRNLFDFTSSGVVVFEAVDDGLDFIIKDCNGSVERIEKIARDDGVDRRVLELFPGLETERALAVLRQVRQTGIPHHFGPVNAPSRNRNCWRQGHVYAIPTGQVVLVYDDVTREHEADLERAAMEARLQRAKKMEAIGLLAGGVAHDLNNILAGITGYPELLMLQLEADSSLRKPLEAIHASGQRAAAVVADLLTVARGIASERRICAMNPLIRDYLDSPEARKLLSHHPGIAWTTRLSEDLHHLICSPIHIKKSLMNLVTNAAEA
ncbi:MAG: Diguanylate cyclase, partial [uncultured bacterium]